MALAVGLLVLLVGLLVQTDRHEQTDQQDEQPDRQRHDSPDPRGPTPHEASIIPRREPWNAFAARRRRARGRYAGTAVWRTARSRARITP